MVSTKIGKTGNKLLTISNSNEFSQKINQGKQFTAQRLPDSFYITNYSTYYITQNFYQINSLVINKSHSQASNKTGNSAAQEAANELEIASPETSNKEILQILKEQSKTLSAHQEILSAQSKTLLKMREEQKRTNQLLDQVILQQQRMYIQKFPMKQNYINKNYKAQHLQIEEELDISSEGSTDLILKQYSKEASKDKRLKQSLYQVSLEQVKGGFIGQSSISNKNSGLPIRKQLASKDSVKIVNKL